MRTESNEKKIKKLIHEIGKRAKGPGRVYFTGGASAVLIGWRNTTVDVDIKLDPEPPGIFEAIHNLKNDLDINVELASPDMFIPPLPDWENRSVYIGKFNDVEFYHIDFYAQALSKIERGHERDLNDVKSMVSLKLIDPHQLLKFYYLIEPDLIRYPSINSDAFKSKIIHFLEAQGRNT